MDKETIKKLEQEAAKVKDPVKKAAIENKIKSANKVITKR